MGDRPCVTCGGGVGQTQCAPLVVGCGGVKGSQCTQQVSILCAVCVCSHTAGK